MAFNAQGLAPEGDFIVSSYSGNGNNCIKMAGPTLTHGYVAVCDSKHDNGPAFAIQPKAWKAFISFVA
ncbi:DUF397 domain-containing protein [Streptomyces sp. WP-1]|uniref:DUF397 domain-containing protein n=1 Tax=Streptomyces sp. WP-1 TaxID=3041497 RepID=UPI002647EB6E|nr:DUF397 domain-containing protein [Streptomyces sp. WP-1]WKE68161.1 DUF397 domain-containing protein [Streptomyces sp. WP-1]